MIHSTTDYAQNVHELRCMKPEDLLARFGTLEPPPFSELSGEYRATLLDQGGPWFGAFNLSVLNNPLHGFWLGKAFLPAGEREGHGYNMFFRGGKIHRVYRMRTELRPSRYDGKEAVRLTYAVYNSLCGWVRMLDEVRKVDEGLYLGIGAYGLRRKAPLPFLLEGPVGPFVGPDRQERWPLGLANIFAKRA